MATKTTNYGLVKPDKTDFYNVDDNNNNMDSIDTELKNIQVKADQAFQSASNGKNLIKTAITGVDQEVTIPKDATFQQLADAISQIETGVDTEDATVTAEQILAGMTAYVKGVKVTGTMLNKGVVTITPGTTNQTIPKGYHNGSGYVQGSTSLVTGNLKAGANIFGVQGKASVVDTEDATVTVAQMLAGSTGYKNGSKLTGTMVNQTNKTLEIANHSNQYTIYTDPNDARMGIIESPNQNLLTGFVDGSSKFKIQLWQLLPENVKKGVAIGQYPGYGSGYITGTFDGNPYNFPITVSNTQPTPLANGHIWVNSAEIPDLILVQEALDANNYGVLTYYLVTGSLSSRYEVSAYSNSLTSGNLHTLQIAGGLASPVDWVVMSSTGSYSRTIKFPRPFVYSRTAGNVLNIETAYMWNGSAWVLLSQAGTYVAGGLSIFNRTNNAITANSTQSNQVMSASKDLSKIYLAGNTILKRTGSVYAPYFSVPYSYTGANGNVYNFYGSLSQISGDGKVFIGVYQRTNSPWSGYNFAIVQYTDNGSTYVVTNVAYNVSELASGTTNSSAPGSFVNSTGTYFCFWIVDGSGAFRPKCVFFYNNTFSVAIIGQYSVNMSYLSGILDNTDNYMVFCYQINGQSYLYRYYVDYANHTVNGQAQLDTGGSYIYTSVGMHPTGIVIYGHQTLGAYGARNIYSGAAYSISGLPAYNSSMLLMDMCFTADGTHAVCRYADNNYYIKFYAVSVSGTTISFTDLGNIATTLALTAYIKPFIS